MLQATTTDEGLLRLVKDWREDEGWREFHRRYAPAIAAHARRSGLTHEQAEDVVQTTMIKVATYLPTFEYDRTVCRFRTWLTRLSTSVSWPSGTSSGGRGCPRRPGSI